MDRNAMLENMIMACIYRFFSFERYEYFLAVLAGSIIAIYIIKNIYIIIEKNTIYCVFVIDKYTIYVVQYVQLN